MVIINSLRGLDNYISVFSINQESFNLGLSHWPATSAPSPRCSWWPGPCGSTAPATPAPMPARWRTFLSWEEIQFIRHISYNWGYNQRINRMSDSQTKINRSEEFKVFLSNFIQIKIDLVNMYIFIGKTWVVLLLWVHIEPQTQQPQTWESPHVCPSKSWNSSWNHSGITRPETPTITDRR